jgi:hypothetical protein
MSKVLLMQTCKFVLLFLFLFQCAHSIAQEDKSALRLYNHGRFEVTTPEPLACGESTFADDTLMGQTIYQCVFQETSIKEGKTVKGKIYMINYIDYPASDMFNDTSFIRPFLESSMITRVGQYPATLLYKADADYILNPGLLYKLSYNDGKSMLKARLIWYNQRLYSVQCYSSTADALNTDIQTFFDSFRIVE